MNEKNEKKIVEAILFLIEIVSILVTYMQHILQIFYIFDGIPKYFYFWQTLIRVCGIRTSFQQFKSFIYLKANTKTNGGKKWWNKHTIL